ncbi:uncharacterized protein LOC114523881 [Dendronephthya gigantea]|uniref:uncharacterized protein LOC114523881 n=1 Tax=Dendronephthya gigantea TaxID=151771 RepID=UPI00106B5A1A|nr:uncharacterized protein LOC114523881 [Dendronephthya gigantea]
MTTIQTVLILVLSFKTIAVDTNEDHKMWMSRFASEPVQAFLRTLKSCPSAKTAISLEKKDEILPRYDSIVKTSVQDIPSTEQTKQMMVALFGDEGLYEKDHFRRSGEIHNEGFAFITLWKTFANKSALLKEIQRSQNSSIGSSVFSVLTQMIFLPKDISKLKTWLKEGIKIGEEENNITCGPKVVINYKCCEITAEPILAPEFGSIEMGMG